jgi:hypothetical protein
MLLAAYVLEVSDLPVLLGKKALLGFHMSPHRLFIEQTAWGGAT